MKFIIGLGNPGKEYENTRHNVGFLILNQILKIKNQNDNIKFKIEKKLNAEIAKINIDEEEVILVKPQTFMNLSGESVQKVMQFYKVKPEDVVVVCDDLNLDVGQIRIRYAGAVGGHNGIKSIISCVGQKFWRVRVGIGSNRTDERNIPAESYVLQNFNTVESEKIDNIIDNVANLLIKYISSKLKEETIKI